MADNPVDTKAVDVLAAAAGVPTPAQAKSLLGTAWRYRKLVLVLGGAGLVAAGGGYGYKYLTADPGRASAQTTPPAVAEKPDDPKPGDDLPPIRVPTSKDDVPAVSEIKVPAVKSPIDDLPDVRPPAIKSPADDKTDTAPPLILPPGPPDRPKKPASDDVPDIAPPPAPEIKPPDTDKPTGPAITVPNGDKKKPVNDGDQFQAADKVPTIGAIKVGPAALPDDVIDKKPKTDDPVLRVRGDDAPKVPDVPKVDFPPAGPKKDDPPAAPKIPTIDDLPPPPGPVKKDDAPVIVPPGGKDDPLPPIGAPPVTVPGPKPDVPPVVVGPKDGGPEVKPPEVKPADVPTITIRPPVGSDPPTIPPIDVRPEAPAKRDTAYSEDWHTWKQADTYPLISQEYYHDAKYAAALEAYNKKHRKPGDKLVRVPDLWKLEELFPELVGKTDKPGPADATPVGGGGLKFEPVAPLPNDRRPAPPGAVAGRSSDEYRVTAEAGETVREVARKALGDAGGWKKLYELNPGIDPTLPLPAGTTLRLR